MHNYIQRFPFSFKHKSRQLNKVADALSRWAIFLNSIKSEIMGFEYLKDLEANDEDFQEERKNYTSRAPCKYQICDEFLFFTDRLCIPEGPLRERIIWKSYNRGLRGHMSQDKSIALVEAWYNWLHLKRDVEKFIKHRYTCQNAKGHAQLKHGFVLSSPYSWSFSGWFVNRFHVGTSTNSMRDIFFLHDCWLIF